MATYDPSQFDKYRYRTGAPDPSLTYWEKPANVIGARNLIDRDPQYDWESVGIDRQFINDAYNRLGQYNQGRSWWEWDPIDRNDPFTDTMRNLPEPAGNYQDSPVFKPDYLNQPTQQPGTQLPSGVELANLPGWQKTMAFIMGNGAMQGAAMALPWMVMGGTTGFIAGGPIGGILGAGGALTAGFLLGFAGDQENQEYARKRMLASGYSEGFVNFLQNTFNAGFKALNLPAEWTEQAVGTGMLGWDAIKQTLPYRITGSQDMLDEYLKGNTEFKQLLDNLPAVWDASRSTYEALATTGMGGAISNLPAGIEFLADMATQGQTDVRFAQGGQVHVLGQAEPVKLDLVGTAILKAATNEIIAGGDPNRVFEKYQKMTGFSGQFADMIYQSLADPLNIMPFVERGVVKGVGKVTGNVFLEQAAHLAKGEGIVGTLREYGNLLRQGVEIDGVKAPKPWEMTRFQRSVADVTPDGILKEYRGGLAGAATRTKRSFFTFAENPLNPVGWWKSLSELTPKSKFAGYTGLAQSNWGEIMSTYDDVDKMMTDIVQFSDMKPAEAAVLGRQFNNAEMYTVLQGQKGYSEKAARYQGIWRANGDRRQLLLRVAGITGEDYHKLLARIKEGGPREANTIYRELVNKVQEAQRVDTDPNSGRSLDEINALKQQAQDAQALLADGMFTPDVFKTVAGELKRNPWAFDPGYFKGFVYQDMMNHLEKWAIDSFGVKPESGLIRAGNALKAMQSFLLLDFSPQYAITNSLSNIATRAAEHSFGFLGPQRIQNYLDWIGHYEPRVEASTTMSGEPGKTPRQVYASAEEAYREGGPMAEAQWVAENTQAAGAAAARAGDWIQRVHDMMPTGPMRKVSGKAETIDSIAVHYTWTTGTFARLWNRNGAIPRMPEGVRASLASLDPRLPDLIVAGIEASKNKGDISRLLTGITDVARKADPYLEGVAKSLGIDSPMMREMLAKTNILEKVNSYLAAGASPIDAINAVRRDARNLVRQQIMDRVRINAAAGAARIRGEGMAAVAQSYRDAMWSHDEFWTRHFAEWERTYELAKNLTGPERSALISERSRIQDQEWIQHNAEMEAMWLGFLKDTGFTQGNLDLKSQKFMGEMTGIHKQWKRFFQERQRRVRQFFKDSNNVSPEYRDMLWQRVQDDLSILYDQYNVAELEATKRMGKLYLEMWQEQLGDQHLPGVAYWWKGIHDTTMQRQDLMRAMRMWERGMEPDPSTATPGTLAAYQRITAAIGNVTDRHKAWPPFLEKAYLPAIGEITQAHLEGINAVSDAATGRPVDPTRAQVYDEAMAWFGLGRTQPPSAPAAPTTPPPSQPPAGPAPMGQPPAAPAAPAAPARKTKRSKNDLTAAPETAPSAQSVAPVRPFREAVQYLENYTDWQGREGKSRHMIVGGTLTPGEAAIFETAHKNPLATFRGKDVDQASLQTLVDAGMVQPVEKLKKSYDQYYKLTTTGHEVKGQYLLVKERIARQPATEVQPVVDDIKTVVEAEQAATEIEESTRAIADGEPDIDLEVLSNAAQDIQYLIVKGGGMATKSLVEDVLIERYGVSSYRAHQIMNDLEYNNVRPMVFSDGGVNWNQAETSRPEPKLDDYPEINKVGFEVLKRPGSQPAPEPAAVAAPAPEPVAEALPELPAQEAQADENVGAYGPRHTLADREPNLPPWFVDDLSQAIEYWARDMLSLMPADGDSVILIPAAPDEYPTLRMSQNPQWYKDLYNEGGISRKSVISALERIIKDKGADKIRNNEQTIARVKSALFQWADANGDELTRLYFAGDLAKEIQAGNLDQAAEIYDAWAISETGARLSQEDWIRLAGSEENLNFIQDYWGRDEWQANLKAQREYDPGDMLFQRGSKPLPGQLDMFGQGEDLPLFSGAAQRAQESVFKPTEQPQQGTLFDMRPQMQGAEPAGGEIIGSFAYFTGQDGTLYRAPKDNLGTTDIDTGMPANVRMEAPAHLAQERLKFLRENATKKSGGQDVLFQDEEQRLSGGADDVPIEKATEIKKITEPEFLSQVYVPALKELGWDRGQRGLLNAVNKDRAEAGLEKYKSAKDVPWSEAKAAIAKRVSPPDPLAASKPIPEIDRLTNEIRDAFPHYTEQQVKIASQVLQARADAWAKSTGKPAADFLKKIHVIQADSASGLRDALWQMKAPRDPSLVALHNVYTPQLLEISRMGGMPAPSFAITGKNIPHESFGDITLIGNRRMIDPWVDERNRVLDSDIYSPTISSHAPPVWKKVPVKIAEKVLKRFQKARDLVADHTTGDYFIHDLWDQMVNRPDKKRAMEALEKSPSAMITFLKEQKGIDWDMSQYPLYDSKNYESRADVKIYGDLSRYIKQNGWEKDYTSWSLEVLSVFGEPKLKLRGRLEDYTIYNILAAMTSGRNIRGGEDSMTFGPQKARAVAAKEFRSIDQMHQDEGRLAPTAEMRKYIDEVQKPLLSDYADRLVGRYTYTNWEGKIDTWRAMDDMYRALGEYIKRGGDPSATYSKHGFRNLDADDKAIIRQAAKVLKDTPTEYFEGKPERIVYLDEFSGAVIPKDTPQEIRHVLDMHNIRYVEYDESQPDSRQAAVESFYDQPDVLFQGGADNSLFNADQVAQEGDQPGKPRGAVEFTKEGEAVIYAFKDAADISTLVHELGHVFRRDLDGPDHGIAARWAGAQYDEAAGTWTWTREAEERFADGFTKYLEEGKAPTPQLKQVFERFRAWLLELYTKIRGTDVKLNDEIRGVFERMLGGDGGSRVTVQRYLEGRTIAGHPVMGAAYVDGQFAAYVPYRFEIARQFDTAKGPARVLGINADGQWIYRLEQTGEIKALVDGEDTIPVAGPFTPGTMEANGAMPMDEASMWADGMSNYIDPVLDELATQMQAGPATGGSGPGGLDLSGLSVSDQANFKRWIEQVAGAMSRAKMTSIRVGDMHRDLALLDYNKRYGFDNAAGLIFPYQFWFTRSMLNWSLRFADRPGLLAFFARLAQFKDENVDDQFKEIPSRLKGKIRIPVPFLNSVAPWAGGSLYVDPWGKLFPYREFLRPWERYLLDNTTLRRKAEQYIRQWADLGEYTAEEAQQAINTRSGKLWDRAYAEAQQNEGRDAVDYLSLISSPNLALNLLVRGPEKTGPFPMSRMMQGLSAVTGWEGLANLDPEAKLRKNAKLSEFGEWGPYYIDRMLVNLVADGEVTSRDAQIAMIERQGPAYNKALERVRLELAVREPSLLPFLAARNALSGDGNLLDVLGSALIGLLPGGLLPEGELKLRGLYDDYSQAWARKKSGEDPEAVNNFFKAHPEYEARLALYDEPEERMRRFLIGEIYDRYYALPEPYRNAARAQLGDTFNTMFLNPETKDQDALSAETLAGWAQQLGGYAPGDSAPGYAAPLQFQGGDAAQAYEQLKGQMFPGIGDLLSVYYKADDDQKAALKQQYPQIQQYYNWRDTYIAQNPQLIQYMAQSDPELAAASPETAYLVYMYRAEKARLFPEISMILDEYYSLPSNQRKQYDQRRIVGQYYDWERQMLQQFPQIARFVKGDKSAFESLMGKDYSKEYGTPVNVMAWPVEVQSSLFGYYTRNKPLSSGARRYLYYQWEKSGKQLGSFDRWLKSLGVYYGQAGR